MQAPPSVLDAVVGLAADLSLDRVLARIVRAACELVGAQYGALGVLGEGPDRRLREFVTCGLTDAERAAIGDLPRGHGILGLIIDTPEPLRLDSLGDHGTSAGFPANHPPMRTLLGVPIRIRDRVFGNLYLSQKRGDAPFTEDDEQLVVALAAAAGVAIENARLYEQGSRQQRWLTAAADATAALLGAGDRHDALQLVADRARGASGASMVALAVRHEGGRLLVEAVSGADPAGLLGAMLPLDGTVAGSVLDGAAPVIIDNAHGAGQVESSGFPTARGWPQMDSIALLALRSAGEVVGLLTLGWSGESEQLYRDTDLELPVAFADQVTLAMQVAQAQDYRGRLAVLEDRDRIGRDLHDLVIQRLFAIGLTLDNVSRMPGQPASVTSRVSGAVDDIDATIKDIRHSIFELSAASLPGELRAELGAALAMVTPALGFRPRLLTQGPVESAVSDELRLQLLAVLRELLSNVVRHARASATTVVLSAGEEVVLTVSDDGVGFTPGGHESGLRNMRERAVAAGGTCEVSPGADGGTVVRWRVPTTSAGRTG